MIKPWNWIPIIGMVLMVCTLMWLLINTAPVAILIKLALTLVTGLSLMLGFYIVIHWEKAGANNAKPTG